VPSSSTPCAARVIASVRLPRICRTSSFHLTLLFAGLFNLSALVLFAVIYWSTAFYMTSQLDDAIDSDLTELRQEMPAGGLAGIARMIAERVAQMPNGPMAYLLEDPRGEVLAGNLPQMSAAVGVLDLPWPLAHGAKGQYRHLLYARGVLLPGGAYLLVGADAGPRGDMRELVLRAFGWGFAVTLLLAFGGGVLISGRLLRRVETISRAAREIMAGNLARRIPVRGTDDEFDHLASSLNAMLERTEALVEAMRQVSNDIAHDLRTPLTRLRQRLDLAGRKANSVEELRAALAGSRAEIDAVLETFGALLRIAQIEAGTPRARFAPVDLSELLLSVAELYQPAAEERRQALATDVEAGLGAEGDRELLAQMLANLVENAVRHAPEGAAITLAAKAAPEGVEIVVADDGPGIPPGERDRVFRRFYRLEASRTSPGNGLGLSLVRAIAGLHGIVIELADNEPGLRVRLLLSAPPSTARESDAVRSHVAAGRSGALPALPG
jgi:signal transduction histidine kinase